jgi:predicted HTH transcriptional regulator
MKVKEAIEQSRDNPDLWQQLDAALGTEERPVNSFTRDEFQKRRNVSDSHARRLLKRLVDRGKIKMLGSGSHTYYVLVKDEGTDL